MPLAGHLERMKRGVERESRGRSASGGEFEGCPLKARPSGKDGADEGVQPEGCAADDGSFFHGSHRASEVHPELIEGRGNLGRGVRCGFEPNASSSDALTNANNPIPRFTETEP